MHYTTTGCFTAPKASTEYQRLACYYARLGPMRVHRIGIEDPRHDLLVRIDVRCRNVTVRSEHIEHVCCKAPRDLFDLLHRELARVATDTALCSTKRNIYNSALPGHPRCERFDLI